MEFVRFIICEFDEDEVQKIIMLYTDLFNFTGNEEHMFTASALIEEYYKSYQR